uniref:Uncharacterized protein n=1 Tax=Sus scrofa TaxID=9823 RepID=A0A286ZRS1_PIG
MKVFLLALLAALLGMERAHSLVCFCCMNKNSKFYCLKPTICSDQTTTAWSSLLSFPRQPGNFSPHK